jgi:hypothetical protein
VWVVGHAQVGWFLAWGCRLQKRDRCLVATAAMLPDLDGLSILGGYDLYYAVHHVWLHNVMAGAIFAGGVAAFARRKLLVLLLAFAAVALHVVSDGFGLLALEPLWPLSNWVFWPNDESYWVAAIGEVGVPVLLLAAQVALARREGISILEMLPARAERWLRDRWAERRGRRP